MKKKEFPLSILELLDRNHIEYKHINNGSAISIADFSKKQSVPYSSIVKALVVKTPTGCVIAALSGDKRLSMEKLSAVLGFARSSLSLLPKDSFESLVGVPIGATPPFGIDMPLIIDRSLACQNMIYCSGGTLVDIIGMKSADFVMISKGSVEDIAE